LKGKFLSKSVFLFFITVLVILLVVACNTTGGSNEVKELILKEEEDTGSQQGVEIKPAATATDPDDYSLFCPYDGVAVGEAVGRPLAVIIENSSDARPQSGYQHACIVFEMVAEGGITRTLAIFGHDSAEIVGPIRSARPYFVEIVKGYDTLFSHWGGSDQAYQMIADLGIPDLDQMSKDIIGAYWRDSSRIAPHNGYSSTQNLYDLSAKLQYSLFKAA